MPLEQIVERTLAEAAAEAGVPAAAVTRLEKLASDVADGDLDPVRDKSEMARRIDYVLLGYDA